VQWPKFEVTSYENSCPNEILKSSLKVLIFGFNWNFLFEEGAEGNSDLINAIVKTYITLEAKIET
jgi:hypothetical protein